MLYYQILVLTTHRKILKDHLQIWLGKFKLDYLCLILEVKFGENPYKLYKTD